MTIVADNRQSDHTPLRSYAELGAFAIARNLVLAYRIWLLARHLDHDGRGFADRNVLIECMNSLGLSAAHLRTARRTPLSSIFFTVLPDRIEYRSLKSVCLALGVEPGRTIEISIQTVTSVELFNAALYAAWFIGQGKSVMISRERLSALFNVSDVTMRRWESVAGIQVQYNVGSVPIEDLDKAESIIPRDKRTDGDRLGQTYTWTRDGVIYWQTVNTYAGKGQLGSIGNTRKVGRAVRAAVENCGDGANVQRVFYTKENMPRNYQLTPGACYKASGQHVSIVKIDQTGDQTHGSASIWIFSEMRPVPRREVMV